MKIEVWLDIICPYCFVAKKTLDLVLAQFPFRDEVEVVYRSFELHPAADSIMESGVSNVAKVNQSSKEAKALKKRLKEIGVKIDLSIDLVKTVEWNSRDAHRLIKLAAICGKDKLLLENMMDAYFSKGEGIGPHSALTKLGVLAGLHEEEIQKVLSEDTYLSDVKEDEEIALSMGIDHVPFFVFNEKYALRGAVSKAVLREAIRDVWDAEHPERRWYSKPGIVCTAEGCSNENHQE